MEVKVKKMHKNAVIPKYAKPGDAGLDLTAVSYRIDERGNHVYDTGLAFEIPKGHVGLLFPRSSISKTNLSLRNSVGVIDSGYRGSVSLKFSGGMAYLIGDRVGQMIIMPYPSIQLVESELSSSERGEGGYGSTGK
jgi:dUTP pyrophosphatase